ncbi:ParA family protein [Allorhizobium sp. BGMRC 0089]|uniref:ParA family protein n=1 Tax=Allorhizobium sonneratiae TaxID=2934936 RepID=UPI0020343A26|nr:ParA family protein [Allorhizobium sonneratiae]MCM2293183.1 ParA family protein [Allorhizobium sonneratiae]
MPIISFANSKGGAGKTTALVLLANELVRRDYKVAVIDLDPQYWVSRWFAGAEVSPSLRLASSVTAQSFAAVAEDLKARYDYVLIDLPGMKTPFLPTALSLSDHALIPVQGSAMDAEGAAQVLDLIQMLRRRASLDIAHSVVLSRVNSLVTTRSLRTVKEMLATQSVRVLNTPIIERAAFRDMFEYRCAVHRLDPERVSNVDKAVLNAECYADEVELLVPAMRKLRAANADIVNDFIRQQLATG